MRSGVIGLIIGVVLGIVAGATIIAPRLQRPQPAGTSAEAVPPADLAQDLPKLLENRPSLRWKMASAVAGSLPIAGTAARRFDSRIAQVSRGQIEIRFYEPGTLVPASDVVEAVGASAVDSGFAAPGLFSPQSPAFAVFGGIPFGPDMDELLAWMQAGGGDRMLDELARARGVHAIVCGVLPRAAAGWFRSPIETIADLRGLRMRIDGPGGLVLERLGVQVQPLGRESLIVALESGLADAVAQSSPAIDSELGLQTFLQDYYLDGWQRSASLLLFVVSQPKWSQLRAGQQQQIETVCGDNVRFSLAESAVAQYPALKALYAAGVRLHRWPPPIADELRRTWGQIVEERSSRDAEFRRVFTSLADFRREYAVWHSLSAP
jgi:TRAP-type mannitol/chloroaromatic compound transport system substrate-binding protein